MKIEDLLKTHEETVDAIFNAFKVDNGYGEIDNQTDQFFYLSEDHVMWQDTEFEADSDAEYANDVRAMYENETHYLLYVDNGCGDTFYQIFNKAKQITE